MNVSINVKEKNIGNQVKKTSKNKLPSYLFLKKNIAKSHKKLNQKF